MFKYEIIIYWSDEVGPYIAEVPELPGCMADEKTHDEVLKNVTQVIKKTKNRNVKVIHMDDNLKDIITRYLNHFKYV
jgi:predicted RNase H-like HicB family nuclease